MRDYSHEMPPYGNRELTLEVVKICIFFGMEGLHGGNVSVYQYLYFIIVEPGLSDKISEDAQAKNMRRNSGQGFTQSFSLHA
ncbi:unnamed protein product [Rhizophagus irregularis]|uniref:Uncharacterized protein n=1 Tax=Rhizophagus irregularis TaxID=588596 RepID=A0A916EHY5_9GLOM|nr:unnamed protein product [Rhizophagus irregularis]CAB5388791.1 unnamed protein product [Rhizophagus irregularis]